MNADNDKITESRRHTVTADRLKEEYLETSLALTCLALPFASFGESSCILVVRELVDVGVILRELLEREGRRLCDCDGPGESRAPRER